MPDPSTNEITLNGIGYAIYVDPKKQTRALERSQLPTNAPPPGPAGRLRRVQWNYWGPVGESRQSASNGLGHDFSQNMDTRNPRRLLPAGARNAVTLTGTDPTGNTGTGLFDGFLFDAIDTKFDGSNAAGNVVAFDEQGIGAAASMFAHRGSVSTQVLISNHTAVSAAAWSGSTTAAVSWHSNGYVALGTGQALQKRTLVTATSATYADVVSTTPAQTVYSRALATGSDRCWSIQAGPAAADINLVTYTLDAFLNTASAYAVGDSSATGNGVGCWGPYTMFGQTTGIYATTNQGQPIPLSTALRGHSSANNGRQWADPGWGWNYYISDIGLRATNGSEDNPVGIGERMREFTGHSGRPTAVWTERGELFVAYLTTNNDTYTYRGVFSKVARAAEEQALNFGSNSPFYSQTAQTGQPDFYPFHYLAAQECDAGFSTNTPTNTEVWWGEGTNAAYEVIDRLGRDDLFAARVYDTNGGVWFGTMMDVEPHLLRTLRVCRVNAKNITSGSTFTIAWSFDGGAYVDTGTVSSSGYKNLRPLSGSTPLTNVSGHTMKPRITLVAAGAGASTTPPELADVLDVEYDERPEMIEQITIGIDVAKTPLTSNQIMANLLALSNDSANGPFPFMLPDDLPPTGATVKRYGMVGEPHKRQDTSFDQEIVDVVIYEWLNA